MCCAMCQLPLRKNLGEKGWHRMKILDLYVERMIRNLIPHEDENRVIIELRCKLELRTLFLRASLAINTGLIAGLVVQIVKHLGGF